MDADMEKRMAAMIMEEAARLRKRADAEGVHVYLAKPTVRVRPNRQFLKATVRSIEQSNRIVEVNEMWRRRDAELEFDRKRRRGSDIEMHTTSRRADDDPADVSCSEADELAGLRDAEMDQFLQSRVKRGRGAVGSRMDETGPYPLTGCNRDSSKEEWEKRLIGPSLPQSDWKAAKRNSRDDDDEHLKKRKKKKKKRNKEEK